MTIAKRKFVNVKFNLDKRSLHNSEMYVEAGNVLVNYLDSIIVDKEKVTFIDKLKAILFAQLAIISADFGKYDEAKKDISIDYQYALRFDSAPSYSPQDIKFLDGTDLCAVLSDGLGESAARAIENFVFQKAEPGEALDFVKNKFAELKNT